jgi:hypothetical protein
MTHTHTHILQPFPDSHIVKERPTILAPTSFDCKILHENALHFVPYDATIAYHAKNVGGALVPITHQDVLNWGDPAQIRILVLEGCGKVYIESRTR